MYTGSKIGHHLPTYARTPAETVVIELFSQFLWLQTIPFLELMESQIHLCPETDKYMYTWAALW